MQTKTLHTLKRFFLYGILALIIGIAFFVINKSHTETQQAKIIAATEVKSRVTLRSSSTTTTSGGGLVIEDGGYTTESTTTTSGGGLVIEDGGYTTESTTTTTRKVY